MSFESTNLAVFDESIFECIDVKTVEVSKIHYQTEPPICEINGQINEAMEIL
jgi:hypothetical protein